MDIKIKPGGASGGVKEIAEDAQSAVEGSGSVSASGDVSSDPVTQIACQLVEGRIDTAQAVDALIAQTMSMDMVARAPESLRQEVEAVLRNAIESDPYLVSLVHQLD